MSQATDAAPDSLFVVREAGLMERYHITRCELNFDACVIVAAKYTSATGTKLEHAAIFRALKKVVLAHAALCVRIDTQSHKVPRFVRLPTINLQDAVANTEVPNQPLDQVIAGQLQRRFDTTSNLPLWRILVHDTDTIIFSYHHGIGDGMSGVAFHRAFRAALNDASEGPVETIVACPTATVLEEPIEKLADVSVSLKTFCQTMFDTFAPQSWKTAYVTWTGGAITPSPRLSVNVRLRKIEPRMANDLLNVCREHNCTLTSFLHTLTVLVLSHLVTTLYKDALEKRHKYFSAPIAVSLRQFTGVSPLSMADHPSAYYTHPLIDRTFGKFPPAKETFPWQTAAELQRSLRQDLKKTLEVTGTIRYIDRLGIWEKFFLEQVGKNRACTFELSNVGAMPRDDEAGAQGDWGVDHVYFVQNDVVAGAAFKMNVAGSPSGSIHIGYTWGPGVVSDDLMEDFITELHGVIESIL